MAVSLAETNGGCTMSEVIANNWSLRFRTKDGMYHPLRIEYKTAQTESVAREYAEGYLAVNEWLESIDAVYPTETQP